MSARRVSVPRARQNQATLVVALLLGSVVAVACSDAKRPSSAPGETAGSAGKVTAGHGAEQTGGADTGGGDDGVAAGQGGTNQAGDRSPGLGGSDGGAAGTAPLGGAGPDPIPPVGDPPICPHGLAFEAGTQLPLSGVGDDLLQAVTPDDLTIAWKTGDHFYVADWDGENGGFLPGQEVANSAQYSSVTLSPDGLQLIGIKHDLTIVEQIRGALQPFDDAAPEAGDFADFNAMRASVPLANQVLADALVSSDDASLFFSHFTTGYTGSRPTVFESRRSGTSWSFANPDLGKGLYADDEQRRIPTGVSSDALTLFYRDEVNGDFRAAWRVNPQVSFAYSEVLTLGVGVQAAAPVASCRRIYYSAPGADGLDIFVAEAVP